MIYFVVAFFLVMLWTTFKAGLQAALLLIFGVGMIYLAITIRYPHAFGKDLRGAVSSVSYSYKA
jgi:hypothetical protein